MSNWDNNSRRSFIKKLGLSAAVMAGVPKAMASDKKVEVLPNPEESPQKISANDTIRIGCVGMGIMGMGDVRTALEIDGVELAGVCDLYEGRLTRSKEIWGNDLMVTKNYQDLLDRDDIDAIIVATSDHWHKQVAVDAMKKGKAVYLEKPITQTVEEGHEVIRTQEETGQVLQVGSQYVSSILRQKAKELFQAGEIGELNMIEASFNRHSHLGAWQYSIPPDASPETVDWETFVSNTTKRDFSAKRFFRWRNYQDYGTGMAGDLYVHLLSMVHFITGSKGPNRIFTTGGLRYWKDGRNVPDVQLGMYDYPESDAHAAFNLSLRCNFVDGSESGNVFRLVGSEGSLNVGWSSLTLKKNKFPKAPGYGGWDSFDTFPEAVQKEFVQKYNEKYPEHFEMDRGETEYQFPDQYKGDRYLHFKNFFNAMRGKEKVVEGPVFGLRAAGPALAGNNSYFEDKIVGWDPENMKMT